MRIAALLFVIGVTGVARADGAKTKAWSDADPRIATEVGAGKPLVIRVIVPMCSNAQINCGSSIAGKPGDTAHNVYWGASFGQRRFFERKNSGWTRVELTTKVDGVLERGVYKRTVSRAAWGGSAGEQLEEIVVLDAIHGDAIDGAVDRFWKLATNGGEVSIDDAGTKRTLRVSVAGYAGHNRLMDGKKLPAAEKSGKAIPSFVMACESDAYFSASLKAAGSEPIVMTKTLMAPEGYVVDAIARAIGENGTRATVRAAAANAYASFQKLSPRAAGSVFADLS